MRRLSMLFILLFPVSLFAQTMWYEGGKGDGHSLLYFPSFYPQLNSSSYVYTGGKADGGGTDQLYTFYPQLIDNQFPYAGGKRDGNAIASIYSFQRDIIDNYYPYQGGLADGSTSDGVVAFQHDLINNYYPYAGGIGDGWSNSLNQSFVLPLVLISFEGQAMGDYNSLSWTTSIEENVDYFLVEKSKTGADFRSIGNVNAVGNSSVEQDYEFNDHEDVQGVRYYKLKMTDIDQSYKYSKVIKLINEKLDYSVVLAPNPASKQLRLRLSKALSTGSELVVLDISGKVMIKERIGKDEAVKNINIRNLANGQYMLYLQLGSDKVSLPFIKN